jgi:phosphoenolpyruvate carboxykinase (ATP)
VRFGTVLENVIYDEHTRRVDYTDDSVTQNTRASYPLEHIENAKVPAIGGHPKNVIFLTCDAFGVLPPVSRLTPEQAMYHFISGYTAKVAGTEMGITEPVVTFSACFGAAFLVWHPGVYAELLAKKLKKHGTRAWLVNTGWIRGSYGSGTRISLPHTRSIINAIHDGSLDEAIMVEDEVFGLHVPTSCPGVPEDIMLPRDAWSNPSAYDESARKLASLFDRNFQQFKAAASPAIIEAGPNVS